MKRFTDFTVCWIVSVTMLELAVFPIQAETAEENALREDFNQSYQNIQQLGKDKDFPGLLREAEEVSSEWKAKSMEHYGELTLKICSSLRSNAYPLDSPEEDIRGVARKAIETFSPEAEDNISIDTHYWLVSNLQEKYTYTKGTMTNAEWAAQRKAEGDRWMVAWDRMEATIDLNWDKNDLPVMNVVPPLETGLPGGVSPNAIVDETQRVAYENAIENNNNKSIAYREQYEIRNLKEQFSRSLMLYFSGTYGIEPYNDAELQDLLAKHVKEEEIRSAIFAALEVEKGKVRMEP